MSRAAAVGIVLAGCVAPAAAPPVYTAPPAERSPAYAPSPVPAPVAPAPVAPATPRIVRLSVGEPDCGLDADGQVWDWSSGAMVHVAPSLRGATQIVCSAGYTCVTAADGRAACWGNNSYGALGDGTEITRDAPTTVVGLADVAEVRAHGSRTCARTTVGDVYCWGDSEFGKAGDGRMPDNDGREKTAPGAAILHGAVSLAVAEAHACARLADGRLSCWGQNNSFALGQPQHVRALSRPTVLANRGPAAVVATGGSVTCTIDGRGAVACWGRNLDGILGPAGPAHTDWGGRADALAIPLPEPALAMVVGTGGQHACAILASLAVACWGDGEYGELGNAARPLEQRRPSLVAGLGDVDQIAASVDATCALDRAGVVWCWGKDVDLRDGSREDALVPVRVEAARE